jgi:diacylglycerol O-acyltransferase
MAWLMLPHGIMDGNALSPLDASFLYFERPNQLMHVGCVGLLDGPPVFEAFVAAFATRLAGLERYHERPRRPVLDLGAPRWERDSHFEVRHHVRRVGVPAPGGDAELHALIDALFVTPFDPEHPLWEVYLIEGLTGGRAAFLWKVHHCMIDGVSGAQVLELLADPLPGAPAPAAPAPTAAAGLAARLRALADPSAVAARARDALHAAGIVAMLVREPISRLPFNGPLSDARRITWAAFSLEDFLALRGAAGCKVNDVVLAVITGALRRYLIRHGVRPEGLGVRALIPVNVRADHEHLKLGNRVSAMLATLPVGIADPVERLRTVGAHLRALKEAGQPQATGLLLELAGRLPTPLGALVARMAPAQPFLNLVCTNVPGPQEPRTLLGRRLLEVHPIVPLFEGMGLGFAILSYAGQLSIGLNADPSLVPDVGELRDALVETEAELRMALAVGPTAAGTPALRVPAVGDLMTAKVVTLAPRDSLGKAWRLMQHHRIRHLPVVDPTGRLVGLVTHRDLLAASASSFAVPTPDDRVRLLGWRSAADVMETHVSVAAADAPAAEAGQRMARQKIGCLPVVDEAGRVTGIVTEEDFLRWATERMTEAGGARLAG